MKKILLSILIVALALTSLISCEVFSKDRTLTVGVSTSNDGISFTETVAAIITEADGTVHMARLDAITYVPKFDSYGAPVAEIPTALSEKGGTAYDELRFFEEYIVGKTVSEILAIPLDNEGRAKDAELRGGCSLSLTDYIGAIEKADKNEYKTAFRSKNLDFALAISLDVSSDAENNTYTLTGNFAAVAGWKDTVAAAIIDANEVTLSTDQASAITDVSYKGTKLEQGDGYNMKTYNPYAIGEWYEQAADYVANLKRTKLAGSETEFPEHTAGCTIGTDEIRAALAKAAEKLNK